MRKFLIVAALAASILVAIRIAQILRPVAEQSPAIAWNARTATYHAAVTTAHAAEVSAHLAEASAALSKAAAQLADEKQGAMAQLRAARQDVADLKDQALAEVKDIRETADRRLGDAFTRVDRILDLTEQTETDAKGLVVAGLLLANERVSAATDTIIELKPSVQAVLTQAKAAVGHAGGILAQVEDTAPLFLDCDHNPDCLFNRYQGTSKSFEGIAFDVHKVTTKFTAPRPLKAKIWDALTLGITAGAQAAR